MRRRQSPHKTKHLIRHIFSVQSSQTAVNDLKYDLCSFKGRRVSHRDRAVPDPARINRVDGQVLKASSRSQMVLTENFLIAEISKSVQQELTSSSGGKRRRKEDESERDRQIASSTTAS